jgi:hypothetical protein
MAVIDTLKLARALRDRGGFTQNSAEATAEALNEALGVELATKADLRELELRLEARFDKLAGEIVKLRGELLAWLLAHAVVILAVVAALMHFLR